jgi:predicted nicotinamide N-methyase
VTAPTTKIAGYPVAWTRIELEVQIEDGVALHDFPAAPVELYALADAESAIDAAALLREREIPDPPYWALPWTGARAIAAIASNMDFDPGLRVLDLGCGLGLAGLAAARRGAAVTFGDYLEEPVAFAAATLERLGLSRCCARLVDFTSALDDGSRFDLILAADIVYDPAHYGPLASYLETHLAADGTILLTESLRADATVFLDGLLARGFADEKCALWVTEDGRRERTWLHGLKRTSRSPEAAAQL